MATTIFGGDYSTEQNHGDVDMKPNPMAGCAPAAARFGRCAEASALVEFALALPVVAMLAVGTFDFGLAFQQKHRVTSAAQAGAQLAAQNRSLSEVPIADIVARVRTAANDTGSVLAVAPQYYCVCPEGGANFACDTDPTPCAAAGGRPPLKYVEVDVRHSIELIFDYPGMAKTVALQATSTMRVR